MNFSMLLAIVMGGGVGVVYSKAIAELYAYIDTAVFVTINTALGG